jgi:hypothetical protein
MMERPRQPPNRAPQRQPQREFAGCVYGVDVLTCPRCEGPMRWVAFIETEHIARRILEHLGIPSRAPPRGRALPSGEQRSLVDDRGSDR